VTDQTSKKKTVLLIEDEVQIRRLLRVFLERHDYHVVEAHTGEDGIGEAARCNPDAILLDLGLPDMDGTLVLKHLREWSHAPILVVSVRGHEDDKINALNDGADDYITKPFSTGEVLARLRVAQRRAQPAEENKTVFHSGMLDMDLATRTVKVAGHKVKLTATEYSLLCLFVKHAGKVLTHSHLLREIWGEKDVDKTGYLRVYMAHLREKLEANPAEPELLITEPGVGYRLVTRD
jgi:two-component system KDP operon response regulator KdpE